MRSFPTGVALFVCALSQCAFGDTFGIGANSFSIDFVAIGNPGNPAYGSSPLYRVGAVAYEYQIGKFEISEQMIDKANALGGLGITKDTRGPDKPATSVTGLEAARFVNWLNTSTGSTPAYKFDANGILQRWQPTDPGYNSANQFRNRNATYFLPGQSEWFKAAYFDSAARVYYDYPTGSNSAPDGIDFVDDPVFDAVFADSVVNPGPNDITDVGKLSPYGTAGQGGNVFEWIESQSNGTQNFALGGGWTGGVILLDVAFASPPNTPRSTQDRIDVGFRVARVPEPSALVLAITPFSATVIRRRR